MIYSWLAYNLGNDQLRRCGEWTEIGTGHNRQRVIGKSAGGRAMDRHKMSLNLPLALQHAPLPRRFAALSYAVSALILIVIVWASLFEIREIAIAQGQIVPAGAMRPVQHLEGGEVERVLVKEGDVVMRGAPLLQLRPVSAASDLAQISARVALLEMRHETLSALLDTRLPSFGASGQQHARLALESHQVYRTRSRHLKEQRVLLSSQVVQRQSELDAITKEISSLRRQVEIQGEQFGIRLRLYRGGNTSRRSMLEAESVLEQTKSRLFAAEGRLSAGRKRLAEAQTRLSAGSSDAERLLRQERVEVAGELAELRQQLVKNGDRLERHTIRAPVRGVVQELVQRAPGEVVRSGDLVAQLMPLERGMVAEVRVKPIDIGHVRIGNNAKIRLSAFDSGSQGNLLGIVTHLSPTTFSSDTGEPYYKAILDLHKTTIKHQGLRHKVMPGMVLHADIITGSKSLMRYLLKPVYRSLAAAPSD